VRKRVDNFLLENNIVMVLFMFIIVFILIHSNYYFPRTLSGTLGWLSAT